MYSENKTSKLYAGQAEKENKNHTLKINLNLLYRLLSGDHFGQLSVLERPNGLDNSRVGVGGGCLDTFSLIYLIFPSLSLWDTVEY